MENNRTRLRAILAVGSLALGLLFMWFFSNFFYDLFWAFLDGYHVRQADVIAYTLAHIIPFVVALIVVAGLYFPGQRNPRHGVVLCMGKVVCGAISGNQQSPSGHGGVRDANCYISCAYCTN